jgi:hypothetical protein
LAFCGDNRLPLKGAHPSHLVDSIGDYYIGIFNPESKALVKVASIPYGSYGLSWNLDNSKLAGASYDKKFFLYDLFSGNITFMDEYPFVLQPAIMAGFSPKRDTLATIYDDGVQLYDLV